MTSSCDCGYGSAPRGSAVSGSVSLSAVSFEFHGVPWFPRSGSPAAHRVSEVLVWTGSGSVPVTGSVGDPSIGSSSGE